MATKCTTTHEPRCPRCAGRRTPVTAARSACPVLLSRSTSGFSDPVVKHIGSAGSVLRAYPYDRQPTASVCRLALAAISAHRAAGPRSSAYCRAACTDHPAPALSASLASSLARCREAAWSRRSHAPSIARSAGCPAPSSCSNASSTAAGACARSVAPSPPIPHRYQPAATPVRAASVKRVAWRPDPG